MPRPAVFIRDGERRVLQAILLRSLRKLVSRQDERTFGLSSLEVSHVSESRPGAPLVGKTTANPSTRFFAIHAPKLAQDDIQFLVAQDGVGWLKSRRLISPTMKP